MNCTVYADRHAVDTVIASIIISTLQQVSWCFGLAFGSVITVHCFRWSAAVGPRRRDGLAALRFSGSRFVDDGVTSSLLVLAAGPR